MEEIGRVISLKRLKVLGAPVHAVDMSLALSFVDDCVRDGHEPACIFAMNPEKVYALRRDERLARVFDRAALIIPDGIGVVAAVRLLNRIRVRRVPGADLMERICSIASERGYRLYLYGASEEVNARAVTVLKQRYPGIRIVGRSNGYVKQADNVALVQDINESGADILFVALGSPKQERWIEENIACLNVKVCQGIGGTLDTIAGTVKRAPRSWQALGLEWAYRLVKQPSRARRQVNLVRFTFELLSARALGRFS